VASELDGATAAASEGGEMFSVSDVVSAGLVGAVDGGA